MRWRLVFCGFIGLYCSMDAQNLTIFIFVQSLGHRLQFITQAVAPAILHACILQIVSLNSFPAPSCFHCRSFCLRRVFQPDSESWASISNTQPFIIIFPPLWNRQIIDNHLIIRVGQSFGSTEPIGTAPNINLQQALLIIRIIRSVEQVKQRQLRLTQIQILFQNFEE